MLVAKGAHRQNDGEVRRRDQLMSALGPSRLCGRLIGITAIEGKRTTAQHRGIHDA